MVKFRLLQGILYISGKSKNVSICEPIIKAINEVVAQNNKCGFVETADLPSNNQKIGNGDDIHFCNQVAKAIFDLFI